MAYIVKDVCIDSWTDFMKDKTSTTVTVSLECTHGQAADLLKGVGNDGLVQITVPYGTPAQIIAAVKAKIAEKQKWRGEEMELFDKLYNERLEDY